MSSSANQQIRIMGLRRPNKRARVDPVVPRVDPIVARVVPTMAVETARMEEHTARMLRACEDTLDALARFNEECERRMQAKIAIMNDPAVAEDGIDDSGFCYWSWGTVNYGCFIGVVHEADRPRCLCCNQFVGPIEGQTSLAFTEPIEGQTSLTFTEGTVYNPISLSSDSVSGEADVRELEDDGASAS